MNPKLLRGSLETIVIKLLHDQGEMYGYEITQKVKDLTEDGIQLTEGALYPALHKLEGKGTLTVKSKKVGNRYRKYYSLTPDGRKEMKTLLDEMQEYIATMQLIINPKTQMI